MKLWIIDSKKIFVDVSSPSDVLWEFLEFTMRLQNFKILKLFRGMKKIYEKLKKNLWDILESILKVWRTDNFYRVIFEIFMFSSYHLIIAKVQSCYGNIENI